MIIQLSKELELFVRDAVRGGRYASEDAVIRDALTRLRRDMPADLVVADQPTNRKRPARPQKKVRTEAELREHMLDIGLMSRLPDSNADFDDPGDQLIAIKGEPLSETIIRERR
jgi:Arc/MetJ-type ribon-helix-helix transcriptional regulator